MNPVPSVQDGFDLPRDPARWLLPGVLVTGLGLPFLGTLLLEKGLTGFRWVSLPLHSSLEVAGASFGLVMAVLILTGRGHTASSRRLWIACALICMPVLDAFHGTVPLGNSFIWMHSLAVLAGGLFFSLVWLPDREIPKGKAWRTAVFILVLSLVLSFLSVSFPDLHPAMRSGEAFSPLAQGINLLGGGLTLLAAGSFGIRYAQRRELEDLLLLLLCLLFGTSGIIFQWSEVWEAGWWFWHALRFLAYLSALWFVFHSQRKSGEEVLRAHDENDRLVGYRQCALEVSGLTKDTERTLGEVLSDVVEAIPAGWQFPELVGARIWIEKDEFRTENFRKTGWEMESELPLVGQARGAVEVCYLGRAEGEDPFLTEEVELLDQIARELALFVERKRGVEARKAEHKKLLALLDGLEEITYVSDPKSYELLHVNQAFRTVWGEDSVGKVCYEVIHGRQEPCPFCTNDRILGENFGKPFVWEFQDEVTGRWYRCSDKGVRWPDGREVRFEIAFDITEEKALRGALLESEDRFRRLAENAPDMIYRMGLPGGAYEYVSPASERIWGFPPEEVYENPLIVGECIHPDWEDYFQVEWEKLLRGEAPPTYQYRIIAKDGSDKWLHQRNTVVLDEDGTPIAIEGIVSDVTARVQAQEALESTAQDLRRSNEELEQFAYVASHDLQEPLRMVASFTQLLEKQYGDKLDGDAADYMGFIVDGATRMQALINDLLEFSRVSTRGKDPEPSESVPAVDQAVSSLLTSIQESGAQVSHGELPVVMADASQLVRLFQNLIGNAIKFRGERPPMIHITAERSDSEWVFSVSDNGIGIDPQYHERVFQIFQRLHGRAEYEGTGIGLALCKRIVERHGGRIWYESEPGAGTRFLFTLPGALE